MRGALIAGLLYEQEVQTPAEAVRLIDRDEIELSPCHSAGGVGALAGVVTPHTPVVVVEGPSRRTAFAPLTDALGPAVRFGNYDTNTLDRLRWTATVLTPALGRALPVASQVDVVSLQGEGLRRGDECHNRCVASSALLFAKLAPAIAETAPSAAEAGLVLRALADNAQFFLALSMAAAKCIADEIHEFGPDGIVTAIASNGRSIGVRVSGCGEAWFVAPGHVGDAIWLDGFTADDACPPMGDSSVTETVGLGAFALTAAPSLAQRLGVDYDRSRALVADLRKICVAESETYLLPDEGFRGSPLGISVKSVLQSGILPIFTGGYAHRQPGQGRVGAGFIEVPRQVFEEADGALSSRSTDRD